jgi:uncharacterized protein (TIGR03000 family)
MYSVVLATMMTVSAGSPGWNCHGCYGCSGYAFGSCHGCFGCFGCRGCSGSSSYYGYWGGSFGCWGCYGTAVTYYTPVYAAPVSYYTTSASYPISVVAQSTPSSADSTTEVARLRAEVEQLRQQLQTQKKKPLEPASTLSPAPMSVAQVTIHVPADAKVFIDDVSCPLTSETRSFNTPQLKAGQKYFYDVRAEVARAGGTVSETQRVVIEAGQQVSVTFPKLAPVTAARR